MSHRTILTPRQRSALFDLPRERSALIAHYVLSDRDLGIVRRRVGAANQLGFALQLCAFRWPGRLIQPGETIPEAMLLFIGAQLGFDSEMLAGYGTRRATRYQHSAALQRLFGFRPFEGKARQELWSWLVGQAGETRANVDLATLFLEEFRKREIIAPGPASVERLCADALVAAEKAAIEMIAGRLDARRRDRLTHLVDDMVNDSVSRFVWLRRFEPGGNSADMNRLLDKLDLIRGIDLPRDLLDGIPRARIERLRQQGERLFGDALRKLQPERRFAILGASVAVWHARLADAIIETNDRILGRIWNEAKRQRDTMISENRRSASETLRGLAAIGADLIRARGSGENVADAIESGIGWQTLESLVGDAWRLTKNLDADPLDHIALGHARLRRYARRFLSSFEWQGAKKSRAILVAVQYFHSGLSNSVLPLSFARRKWLERLKIGDEPSKPLWETAVLFELRAGLRSGDIWVEESARYQELEKALLPMPSVTHDGTSPFRSASIPGSPKSAKRWRPASPPSMKLPDLVGWRTPNSAAAVGTQKIDQGGSRQAETLVTTLYRQMQPMKITDLLLEADARIGFTEAFTDLRNGMPPSEREALMTVLLADGINLGVRKMADACPDYSYWELLRIATWHVRPETYHRALATVINAHAALPFAKIWGRGDSSSSDGQHIHAGAEGEAMNVINAKYGHRPGVSSYAHVSDQFAPFHVQRIGATANEAPYVLDGLLLHDSGLKIKEHFTDTGGFSDTIFAVCSMLGFRFAPRIRGLADHRLYAFDPTSAPTTLQPLIAKPVNEKLIREAWPDLLRASASMAARTIVPSQYLRKLASYPRRNAVAKAWREVGQIERAIFTLDWLLDLSLQRRVQIGLNKGEAHTR